MSRRTDEHALRIAMWSGPRNISTAMMRAWENRSDTVVWDEPFYGFYLHTTGYSHPGAEEIMADQGTDWQPVVERCVGPVPDGKRVFFQKQMTHHLLPNISREWLGKVSHCFLIRDPRKVIASYRERIADVTLEDLGFPQQLEIFNYVVAQTGEIPPVLDSRDVLQNPEEMLRALCDQLKIPFQTSMLTWPEGSRETDGVWDTHWYDAVIKSTEFTPYREKVVSLSPEQEKIAALAEPAYRTLYEKRLQL